MLDGGKGRGDCRFRVFGEKIGTNSIFSAARRIYETAGYRLVHQETDRSFGKELIGETWELILN